jgi:hypothetical protein
LTPATLQQVATIAGAVLTIMIFSYLLGDNFIYRIAISIFIGASAAYVLIVSVESVLLPWIDTTILNPAAPWLRVVGLIPFLIGVLLLFKASPRLSRVGNVGLVAVLGIGTSLALVGAINGTLLPLAQGSAVSQGDPLSTIIAVIGTTTVLIYFTYVGVRRPGGEVEQPLYVRGPGLVGQAFIVITLGATYALLIISALTVLTGVITQRLLILKPG